MANESLIGSSQRVVIGSVTKQSSNSRIVFPISMPLRVDNLGTLPDWVGEGFGAVSQFLTEAEPEVQQVSDVMLCFQNDKPKSGLFKNPDSKAPTSELRNFKITRTGDPDDPEIELQFKAFCAFSRELWAWLGEMCGEEVFMNFPTALAKGTPRPAEQSGNLPLTGSAEAEAGVAAGAGPVVAKKSGPKDLAAFHAAQAN